MRGKKRGGLRDMQSEVNKAQGKDQKKWTVPIRRHLAAGENERGERCVLAVCHRLRRQEARRYNKSGGGGRGLVGRGRTSYGCTLMRLVTPSVCSLTRRGEAGAAEG